MHVLNPYKTLRCTVVAFLFLETQLDALKNAEQFELDNQDNRKLVFDKSQTTTYQAIFNQSN